MRIVHLALGGCLTFPEVHYGITPDTGGHIAYIFGAAMAQARRADVAQVDVVTRAFDDLSLGRDHATPVQLVDEKLSILRMATGNTHYLAKEALAAERPALRRAFRQLIAGISPRPDVIHAHFADAVAVASPTATAFGIPLVYTPHSLGIDKANLASSRMSASLDARISEERAALKRADAVVVSSRDEAERQIAKYDVDVGGRTHRVSPGITLPDGPPGTAQARALIDPLLRDPDLPMILAIARPVRKKNLVALMEAYLGSPRLQAGANLVILAGQSGLGVPQASETIAVIEQLNALAAQVPGRIALPERHDPSVPGQLYRLARKRRGIFANPALHEPFGLTILEAAQAGVPVVATREGGPADIVGALHHGDLVDPTDIQSIACALERLIFDADRWNEAANAGARANKIFDWTRWAARVDGVYRHLRAVSARTKPPRRLLVCDIDGTLTGCRSGAAAFHEWCGTQNVCFAVATGRSICEARGVLSDWTLPEPFAFITAVGTEIHRPDATGRLILCNSYRQAVARNWDRETTLTALRHAGARMQPPIEQRNWKLACFGDAVEAERLRRYLSKMQIQVRVVPSHGTLIDILPPHGGKARAMAHLAGTLGVSEADCIVAGDSGNDIDMLSAVNRAIVVGNALPELGVLRPSRDLYKARGHHANGVLEGLTHYGWNHPVPAVPT